MGRILNQFDFAAGGNGLAYLAAGWARPDPEHTWSSGAASTLLLPLPPDAADMQVQLDLQPFAVWPGHQTQRVSVSVNGGAMEESTLAGRSWLGFDLTREQADASGVLRLDFAWPDVASPASLGLSDDRRPLGAALFRARIMETSRQPACKIQRRGALPIARYTGSAADLAIVRGVTGLAPDALAMRLESLGTNCEFGLFQRRCGAEPLGLLRFGGIPYNGLLDGLETGFAALAGPQDLSARIDPDGPEWIVTSRAYRVTFHTYRHPDGTDEKSLLRGMHKTLRFRRDKLHDILVTGEKLYTVILPDGMSHAQARPLLAALCGHGPNALLFASHTTGQPAGTVDMLSPRLFRGSLDGAAKGPGDGDQPGNPTWLGDAVFTTWMSVCANAYRLWREQGGGTTDN